MGIRTPQWEGAINVRDLGGLPIAGGGRIASGRLFRSGRTETMTTAGWVQLRADGVSTVIDLRNDDERGRRASDAVVDEAGLDGLTRLVRPTEDPTHLDFKQLCWPYLNTPKYYADNLRLWPERFVRIVHDIAVAPPGGVLVHCSGGRDRTGLVVMLILQLLGVPHEAIADDYERGVRAANERFRVIDHPVERYRTPEQLDAWVAETRDHLLRTLAELDAADFLLRAGLAPEDLDALRDRLTEDG
ncbi:protein-tyrosine-phosphatase [Tersicoccus solisilvae]|uniref:Protein-tyrosine-phosphatase n=1 Tax=Tersicoccus solisilvae TaxID=1882339 RepID=A0ABQ1NW10_9MICC|nr:tyrosine-protein phosphatase [Tersicoccus solisilvae]GGC81455.1 protein-tyrosine-phosphatase [Tersicoccus solisilvae]